jgi:hypothetical protein
MQKLLGKLVRLFSRNYNGPTTKNNSVVIGKIIMPTDLIHRIVIAAPAEKIYRAISAENGC